MNRISLCIFFILLTGFVFSQNHKLTREEYIQRYRDLAINEMKRSGIPASITLAQGCLESGNGNSELARKSNNHFGIKCKSSWTGARTYHKDDAPNECFRKYSSAQESYLDHTDFLITNARYSQLFALHETDYKQWAHGLKRAGYATDPSYAHRLIKIIEENKLYVYDQVKNPQELAKIEQLRIGTKNKQSHSSKKLEGSQHVVTKRNGLQSIVVKPGDTFESISQELGMNNWEIYSYNDYQYGFQPQANEILYIEYKNRKADSRHQTHTVKQGDTMHYIAQRYGIKLKSLYRRNRMKEGEQPKTGELIYLRKKRPRVN